MSPFGTIITTNLSRMSLLAEQYDIESLAKGLASANIKIRDRTYQFNHNDKIFKVKKPLEEDDFKTDEN